MMHILVTGATGFIGSHVVRQIYSYGRSVTCIVRKLSSINLPSVETIQADLTDFSSITHALQKRTFHVVVDCAAKIPSGLKNDDDDFVDNFLMTRNLLQSLKKNPPEYYLKLSTVDVYKLGTRPINEKTSIVPPNYYALSKRMSEELTEFWGKKLQVPVCILRLTQTFGPGDRSNKFIPSIIRQIKEAARIQIYGDGTDRRDLLFVEDAASLIALCCENKISGIFNLATGKSYSLLEIINILQRLLDKQIPIDYFERKKQKHDYHFDITKLINQLGSLKLTDIAEALGKTFYWEMKHAKNQC